MPAPWPTDPTSPRLRISDPVHYLYSRILTLDLDLRLRDHLIRVMWPYLKAHELNDRLFENRALIASGLSCYVQSVRLAVQIELENVGTERYEILSRHYRAYVETLAKAYRLKGMHQPKARPKYQPAGTRIQPSASAESPEEPEADLEPLASEA